MKVDSFQLCLVIGQVARGTKLNTAGATSTLGDTSVRLGFFSGCCGHFLVSVPSEITLLRALQRLVRQEADR